MNYNGRIISADSTPFMLNRAMNYGDGLFESIRIHNGEILFFAEHMDRMMRGMNAMKMEVPEIFSPFFFHKQIFELASKENISANARVRIGIFRAGKGLYEPETNSVEYFIEIISIENSFQWREENCKVAVFPDVSKNFSSISFFKSMNALPYVMAAIHRKENSL